MTSPSELRDRHPGFDGRIGVARCDISPPVGIYARMWGAATHEVIRGIHRPLEATAITFEAEGGGNPLVLVTLDLGWWREPRDEQFIRAYVLEHTGLGVDQLMINLSHTHAGPSTSLDVQDKPGGHLVRPWLEQLREKLVGIIRDARADNRPARLEWATGRCALAANRHLPSPDGSGLMVAYNPSPPVDDTLLVGRITSADGAPLAVIVNYACHPISLGWGNQKASPDFVGAMREVVERQTGGGPCLFIQGASGDLAPRRQLAAETEIADANGRMLGHAVCSVLESMLPPGCEYAFSHVVESGTQLGVWKTSPRQTATSLEAINPNLDLPARRLPDESALRAELKGMSPHVVNERVERLKRIRRLTNDQEAIHLPIWAWRLGDSFLVGTPAEAYSALQTELRRQFPQSSIAVMNIVNGYYSYLPSAAHYEIENYEVRVSLFSKGSLETAIEKCGQSIRELEHMNHDR